MPLNGALAIQGKFHLNLNPAFFHLVKSPYWWQLYIFWLFTGLTGFGFIYADFSQIGYGLATVCSFTYFFVCFGILFIKPVRKISVREGATYNRHHKLSLFGHSFISVLIFINMYSSFSALS